MAKRLVNNLKDEYLCCRICLDQYRNPKTLPCDHMFCEQCLVIHVAQSMTMAGGYVQVVCPLCRHPKSIRLRADFDVELWVKSLPTDSLVESLLQTVNVHENNGHVRHTTSLPALCEFHGGKPRDAYCFTHAQLMCWECAARNHRECQVDSSEKAKDQVIEKVREVKQSVNKQLSRARDLSKIDRTFTDTKRTALQGIDEMEDRLDRMYASAKHQMALLRGDIETCTKQHLDEWKLFYDIVTSLLEHNHTLDDLEEEMSDNVSYTLGTLESILKATENAQSIIDEIASKKHIDNHFVKFVKDDQMDHFLNAYSSIGFVDSNVDGFHGANDVTQTPRDAPASIAHILQRTPSQASVETTNTTPRQEPVGTTKSTPRQPAVNTAAKPRPGQASVGTTKPATTGQTSVPSTKPNVKPTPRPAPVRKPPARAKAK